METYIPQSPARTTESNLINTVGQSKKQQFNFTDNRPVAVSQRKTLQSIGQQKPMQMKRTVDAMVSNDLRCDLRDRFFTPDTIRAYKDAKRSGKATADFVAESRANIEFAYLGGKNMDTKAEINNWLATVGEHIFIWNPGNLTGGINLGGTNKVPHPTLRGGDPDVDFAGTFIEKADGWHATNDSGHFQFDDNQATRHDIIKYMKTLP